jgi:precorrin-4 methylase
VFAVKLSFALTISLLIQAIVIARFAERHPVVQERQSAE